MSKTYPDDNSSILNDLTDGAISAIADQLFDAANQLGLTNELRKILEKTGDMKPFKSPKTPIQEFAVGLLNADYAANYQE